MRITRLRASHVRKIRCVEMEPGHGLNVICGRNGSGKTSLLEAIYLVAYGRSFRTRRVGEVVTEGEAGLVAFCEVVDAGGAHHQIGVEKAGAGTRVRIDGTDVKVASTLARLLPVVLIGPDCGRLLEEAELRRRVLDWVLFHVEPAYLGAYQRFHRALRQRNAVLRTGSASDPLGAWDRQLAEAGEALHSLRKTHAPHVTAFASRFLSELLPVAIDIEYVAGWDTERGLLETLTRQRESDLRLGHTRAGPQRADLRLSVGDAPARTVLSRGEGKLLAMGLQLAQGAYFASSRREAPVMMIDDLGTELDEENRRRFLRAMESLCAQAFVTTVLEGPDGWYGLEVRDTGGARRFHVEQGRFRQMI